MITTINHSHPRIAAAIKFVEDEIVTALTHSPPGTRLYSTFTPQSWVHYIAALDVHDERERKVLIDKYGTATPHELAYYIYYHGCYEFAVFYWTVLSVAGKSPVIAEQRSPFPHCYFIVEGEVVDPILHYAAVTYPYGVMPPTLHATPHDLFAACYGSVANWCAWVEDPSEWEKAHLAELKELE